MGPVWAGAPETAGRNDWATLITAREKTLAREKREGEGEGEAAQRGGEAVCPAVGEARDKGGRRGLGGETGWGTGNR